MFGPEILSTALELAVVGVGGLLVAVAFLRILTDWGEESRKHQKL